MESEGEVKHRLTVRAFGRSITKVRPGTYWLTRYDTPKWVVTVRRVEEESEFTRPVTTLDAVAVNGCKATTEVRKP